MRTSVRRKTRLQDQNYVLTLISPICDSGDDFSIGLSGEDAAADTDQAGVDFDLSPRIEDDLIDWITDGSQLRAVIFLDRSELRNRVETTVACL